MLETLLAQNESNILEFKENLKSLSGIIKTIVAFANTAGGIIIVGVEDRTKKVVGVQNILDEEERLISAVSDSISPFIIPNVEIQTYRDHELMLIHVPYLTGPYYVKKDGPDNGVYVRFGSTNRVADAEMLSAIRLSSKKLSFDEMPVITAKVEDIDWDTAKRQFKEVRKKITTERAEDMELLVQYGAKIVPSHAGVILYGKYRDKVFPDALVRCVRFLGTGRGKILDFLDINTYPVDAIEQIIHFIEKNTLKSAEIGRIKRRDIPQYPPIALRETVINALLHADYANKTATIMVAIFDDRIEISNPGGLVFGMTLERALAGSSRVRNKVIARVFRELQLIERWGSGLQRIIDACAESGLKKPKFEDFVIEFQVTLYSEKIREITLDSSQLKIINYLKKHEEITTKKAAELWKITPRNARVRLLQLINAGFIKKIGTSEKDPFSVYVLARAIKG